jgi:hypothetical protein
MRCVVYYYCDWISIPVKSVCHFFDSSYLAIFFSYLIYFSVLALDIFKVRLTAVVIQDITILLLRSDGKDLVSCNKGLNLLPR